MRRVTGFLRSFVLVAVWSGGLVAQDPGTTTQTSSGSTVGSGGTTDTSLATGTTTGSTTNTSSTSSPATSGTDPVATVVTNSQTTVINGFGDGSQFTANSNQPGNPPTAIINSVLNLTTATGSLATSAFYNSRVDIQNFTAGFNFTFSNSNLAGDGFTFTVQNDPRGAAALGLAGGYLGYGGVSPSAGFAVNLYNGYPLGTLVIQDGIVPFPNYSFSQFSPVQFSSDVSYRVTLSYSNGLLQASITSPSLLLPLQSSYLIDLPALAGGSLAYVGFTGATGAAVTAITISDFSFATPVPEPPAWALLGGGALMLHAGLRVRRRSAAATTPSREPAVRASSTGRKDTLGVCPPRPPV